MQLLLDTADRAAAEPLLATGVFDGITTNPTILRRAGLTVDDIEDVHRWALAAGARQVFFQSWGADTESLLSRGRELRALGDRVVVKLPASPAGTTACARLAAEAVPTLLTAVYSPGQAMVAAAIGATYIAPYLGRMDDAGRDGVTTVLAMHEVLRATGAPTRVLAASIRDVASMVELARRGVDAFTMAPPVAERLFADPLTDEAVRMFEAHAAGRPS